jgi:hypothetical protein
LQHNKNGVDDLQEGLTPEVSRQLLQYKANDLAQQFLLAQTGICEKWTAFYQKKSPSSSVIGLKAHLIARILAISSISIVSSLFALYMAPILLQKQI